MKNKTTPVVVSAKSSPNALHSLFKGDGKALIAMLRGRMANKKGKK